MKNTIREKWQAAFEQAACDQSEQNTTAYGDEDAMIEVEVKLRIENKEVILTKMKELGFELEKSLQEVDRYYDNDKHQIRLSDQALRIRSVTDLKSKEAISQITFKGKKLDDATMTRPEYETLVQEDYVMNQILNELGFFAVKPYVEKKRMELVKEDMNACIDEVTGLGDFLELEIVVADDAGRESAMQRIENVLKEVGYSISDTTTISYLSQLQKLNDGIPPKGM